MVEPEQFVAGSGVAYLEVDWSLLVRCLSFSSPLCEPANNTPIFQKAIEKACALGAIPFEVIAGTPKTRYGARITLRLTSDKSQFIRDFELDGHPWGAPDWVGLRIQGEGPLVVKAYHQVAQVTPLSFEEKLRSRLDLVMAALHDGSIETYWRFRGVCPWPEFVQMCLEGFSAEKPDYDFLPTPDSLPDAFCVSEKCKGGRVQSISLFADHRALPDDATISRLWTQDIPEQERQAYELALAAVRSTGQRRLGTWHGMLCWTLERSGDWHKAASLLFPVPS